MRTHPLESPAEENRRLRACLNDLVRMTRLPVLPGGEPSLIAGTLLDALIGMLPLSFAFVRLNDPGQEPPLEMTRVAGPLEDSTCAREIGQALDASLGDAPLKWPPNTRVSIGGVDFSIMSTGLGTLGELGIVVAGSQKAGFPEQSDALLLDVAANRAAIALQQGRFLSEQNRVSRELDKRVSQRTRELAAANEELEKSALDLRQIVDRIPGLVGILAPSGEVEALNRRMLDYFGKPFEEMKHWEKTDIIHAEDLPRVIRVFTHAIGSGMPLEYEARLRRFDGVYRWFQVRGISTRDRAGGVGRWYLLITDIDDQKRAEDALRASERNLQLIINTIPAIAWSALTDGSADFFNQHYLDYVGLSVEQLRNWGWVAVVHPDDLEALVATWKSVMASERAGETEARLRRFDGSYRWFVIRANPLRDESGKIIKWYGANLDIDDRKRGEEDLRARELSWRQIVDNIPGLVATMSGMGEVEFLNRQTLEYFGKTNAELKNWSLIGAVHPDDLPRVSEARARAIESGQVYEVEHRCRRSDGVYRWFQVRGLPIRNAEGAISDWYLLLTDIEDRKRAEGELRRAYNSFADAQRLSKTGSFITDLVGDDHNWSEEAYRIFEFDPGRKVTVQRIRDMIHPDDLPAFEDTIARGMTGLNVNFAFRILTARGAMKHVRGVAHVVEQVEGRPMFVGALQDVTESKVAEEALDRARSELAHVARVTSLNALTASIAHEVNQPLAGIITNASTCLRMLDGHPPNVEGARETVRRTLRDGNRAADVIKRLRALYSKKEFTLEPVDLNEATREVIALSFSDLQRNRVVLRSELFEDLPPVTCDRVQLQQVILNLIRNATDAMVGVEDRPRQLMIRTEREDGDCVRVTVRDAGVGLDRQSIEKLFDAFYTTKSGGMGIGLSVSRSIIERHHGRLWAEPNDGPGATFSFSIPFGAEQVKQ